MLGPSGEGELLIRYKWAAFISLCVVFLFQKVVITSILFEGWQFRYVICCAQKRVP